MKNSEFRIKLFDNIDEIIESSEINLDAAMETYEDDFTRELIKTVGYCIFDSIKIGVDSLRDYYAEIDETDETSEQVDVDEK